MRFRRLERRDMPGLNRMLARPSRWTSLLVSVVLLPPVMGAQASPQLSAPGSQAATAPLIPTDPRRPEIQPSLSVDRDPVPSPDIEMPAPAASAAAVPARGSELQKGKDGIYTLHQDVDEVLLSCTVVDEKGHPVEGLTRDDF